MSTAPLLEALLAEQESLQFSRFDFDDAYAIGLDLVASARRESRRITIDITACGQQLFHVALPGTSPDNDQWILRKNRVVGRFFKSSFYIAQLLEAKGQSIEEAYGLPSLDYAASGGAVPINLAGRMIGTITVSGLPHQEDHQMVVAAISRHLAGTKP